MELKPCPFCGDAWIYISDGSYTSGYESFGYKVECRCKGSFMAMSWKITKEKAIEAWNRRVNDDKTDRCQYIAST